MDRFDKGQTLNPQLVIAVAFGGAIGSVARYFVAIASGKVFGLGFPWGTLIINVVGSFLIGVLAELLALKWDLPHAARVFLIVGVCGGFTTFSTFSLEAAVLMERGQLWPAASYIAGSVVLSIAALFAGLHLVRLGY
jgi:fluoride exporter